MSRHVIDVLLRPPVELWKKILYMVNSTDLWYDELTFSYAKHPHMLVNSTPAGDAKTSTK